MSIKTIFLVAIIAFAAIIAVHAHGDHGDHDHSHDDKKSDVIVATNDSFESTINAADVSLVEFFAPWCGHCKQLAPHYDTASTALKGIAQLVSVDCTVEKELCNTHGVQGFPTLKIFRKGVSKPSEYQGGRRSDDIIKFMKKQVEPAITIIADEAKLTAFTTGPDVTVVAFTASADAAETKTFAAVAESLRNEYSFGVSHDAAHAAKFGATAPAVLLFKQESDKPTHVAFTGAFEQAEIEKFVKAEAFPLVGSIGPENFQKYLDRGLPLVWVFVDEKADVTKTVLANAEAAAADFKGQLSVVKLDGVRWGEHAKHFGLSGKLPGIVAEDRENNKNYIFDESKEVTVDGLKAHFDGFVKGTLVANQKSQPIPEKNDGPVTTLVGKNFESIVFDQTKDVLVEFYAPWCGHCKSLAPKYEKLGALFSDDDNIVIAQVDATENDTPHEVKGFPTIVFWPAGDKKNPVTYDGDRSVDAMASFIRENAQSLKDGKKREAAAATEAAASGHEEL